MFNIDKAFVWSFRSKVLKYWRFFKLNVWVKVTMLHQVFHQSMTSLKWLFDPNFKKMLSWKGGASSVQYFYKNKSLADLDFEPSWDSNHLDSWTTISFESHWCPSNQFILLTQGPIPLNFVKKYWELTILKNIVFLSRPFCIFFC